MHTVTLAFLLAALMLPVTARATGRDSDWSDRFSTPAMGPVSALVEFDGRKVGGGDFTTIGPTAANRIASWDGVAWTPLGAGFNSSVTALAVFNGEPPIRTPKVSSPDPMWVRTGTSLTLFR